MNICKQQNTYAFPEFGSGLEWADRGAGGVGSGPGARAGGGETERSQYGPRTTGYLPAYFVCILKDCLFPCFPFLNFSLLISFLHKFDLLPAIIALVGLCRGWGGCKIIPSVQEVITHLI